MTYIRKCWPENLLSVTSKNICQEGHRSQMFVTFLKHIEIYEKQLPRCLAPFKTYTFQSDFTFTVQAKRQPLFLIVMILFLRIMIHVQIRINSPHEVCMETLTKPIPSLRHNIRAPISNSLRPLLLTIYYNLYTLTGVPFAS